MNLNKNLLTFVLMLFCGTWMCPQSADQVPIQDQINLELHSIISKFEAQKYEDSIKFTLLEFKLNELKDSISNYKTGDKVLSSKTINFTTNSIDKRLILHSTITLGYDVDWEKAYAILIESGLKTNLVIKDPSPFVLQTSLDDFYVSYELNIYINHANKKNRILSELHENIQDLCNENGIEILSPHYKSLRDGSWVAKPEKYIPENYQPSYFTVRSVKEK